MFLFHYCVCYTIVVSLWIFLPIVTLAMKLMGRLKAPLSEDTMIGCCRAHYGALCFFPGFRGFWGLLSGFEGSLIEILAWVDYGV